MAGIAKKYAVVTGANKGIGLEICKQLISQGITVILTARDEKRGKKAVKSLESCGFPGCLTFHQLQVTDLASISSLAAFVKSQFGKLDILVNNAAILGAVIDDEGQKAWAASVSGTGPKIDWADLMIKQPFDLVVECIQTNYYGAKRTTEALLPLLHLSDSPRIVNVSSSAGKLKNIPSEWAKEILKDAENLTQEKINYVVKMFLEDFKQGLLEAKGWPLYFSAYRVSKAAMNAYTRSWLEKTRAFGLTAFLLEW